jgi:REP element-mobilizing transposase RayT
MPRPLRIEYEGAWYHVMNRGANCQNIFYNDKHREIFLALLEEISSNFFVEIHSYCLMNNHYHLLVNTRLANLARLMRHLDGVYTQKFNKIEKRDGPLFRGRYKAILVEAETYLLQVSRYIHLNPVAANICSDPYQYPWSSFKFYLDKNKPFWLRLDFIFNLIGGNNKRAQYSKFVAQ